MQRDYGAARNGARSTVKLLDMNRHQPFVRCIGSSDKASRGVVDKKRRAATNLYTTEIAMFIRWQKRKRRIPAYGSWGKQVADVESSWGFVYVRPNTSKQDIHWRAILVEAVRTDSKPSQRHIAYLGGITDSAIEIAAQRAHFWANVSEKLDHLANRVSSEDRTRIEQAIAEKVPRLTREEYDQCYAAWLALVPGIRAE